MNENIDLTKILKDCPEGWEFYSSIYGYVTFCRIANDSEYPVEFTYRVKGNSKRYGGITEQGLHVSYYNGECTLFPSKDQRDWSKFTAPWYKKEKFDPKTLKPFDKIIARVDEHGIWCCEWFSFIDSFIEENIILIKGCGAYYRNCIPYNDDTKHLVGTTDEAPEYYKYWEE